MPSIVVILSSRSLFAEGIASRLRQYPQRVDVRFIDPQQLDYVVQISEIRPSVVIIDAIDTMTTQCCLLCDLLSTLDRVTILRLDAQQNDIRLITSTQKQFNEVADILDIIDQSPHMLGI